MVQVGKRTAPRGTVWASSASAGLEDKDIVCLGRRCLRLPGATGALECRVTPRTGAASWILGGKSKEPLACVWREGGAGGLAPRGAGIALQPVVRGRLSAG